MHDHKQFDGSNIKIGGVESNRKDLLACISALDSLTRSIYFCVPDVMGEYLRDCFFEQGEHDRGCYDVFKLRVNVEQLPDEPIPWEDFSTDPPTTIYDRPEPGAYDRERLTVARLDNVTMKYFWDGDGTLEFLLPDGRILINTDCKKTHGWSFVDKDDWFRYI